MTNYEKPTERPEGSQFTGFAYVEFHVSNAKQVSDWYCLRFGFKKVAYKGLETGDREVASHVIQQDKILFVVTTTLKPKETDANRQVAVKGDYVKDVAFDVTDARKMYEKAIARGAKSVRPPTELKDEFGRAVVATVETYGDCVHTFVERSEYKGVFLPGYRESNSKDALAELVPSPNLLFIDHIVGNQPDKKMDEVVDFYVKCLDFHRFWSVDDKQIFTQWSSLRSTVVADFDEKIKMPINEPAQGLKKSQIQEYVDYHGVGGVQHIALRCGNILDAISNLRSRGLEFLYVPDVYYDDLKKRLANSPVNIKEDMETIQKLNILVDFDDNGYLLQIFTKPVEDRPTLFYEIIQRANHNGFGAGNFKSLFEAIERDQELRGNL